MLEMHATPQGGYSGTERTYMRVRRSFYWKGMRQEVFTFINSCDIFQKNKTETVAIPSLLQPLPIPEKVWSDISIDFETVTFVVMDNLSKYAHFIGLSHPYTTVDVAYCIR